MYGLFIDLVADRKNQIHTLNREKDWEYREIIAKKIQEGD